MPPMFALIAILFVLGYAAIALEHPLKINKAAPALLTGMLIWTVITVGHLGEHDPLAALNEHISGIASILFFLLGAMTVVELMDAHAGFQVITDRITSTNYYIKSVPVGAWVRMEQTSAIPSYVSTYWFEAPNRIDGAC